MCIERVVGRCNCSSCLYWWGEQNLQSSLGKIKWMSFKVLVFLVQNLILIILSLADTLLIQKPHLRLSQCTE